MRKSSPINAINPHKEIKMTDLSQQAHLQAEITLKDEERQLCEVWTRVMGYHRPMASFNTGKKGEFHERQYFCESRVDLAA
jgi:anaerobic ribonucleoside-triphosphate reductase